jgi:hypothetical protein
MATTIHKVGAPTFFIGVTLFPPFLQTRYRHLGLASRRHEVELFNVVTKVSAVTKQQRTRKQKWISSPIHVANEKLPFQPNDVVAN